jgi:hypothetical protein
MKNSTKYLLAAVLVLLTSLTAYNMALRAEYQKGDYKDPLHGFARLDFKNFTEVDLSAAGAANVKIVAGPFGVRLSPQAAEFVKVSQRGARLVVQVDFAKPDQYLGWGQTLVISCPRLAQLTTGNAYRVAGQLQAPGKSPQARAQIQGFRQDSLRVQLDQASNVGLLNNQLGYLGAVAGASAGSTASLSLASSNRIAAADLTLVHRSELEIDNVAIPQLRYHVGDSAKVTLMGTALAHLAAK